MPLFATTKGLDELKRTLREANVNVSKKLVGQALRVGAKIYQKEAQRRAPVGDHDQTGKYAHAKGTLKRTLRVRVGKTFGNRNRKKILVYAGARGDSANDAFYVNWVEFGHRVSTKGIRNSIAAREANRLRRRSIKAGGLSPEGSDFRKRQEEFFRRSGAAKANKAKVKSKYGDVRPHPFLRPAWAHTKQQVVDAVINHLRQGIIAEAFPKS